MNYGGDRCKMLHKVFKIYDAVINYLCDFVRDYKVQAVMLVLYKSMMDIVFYCFIGHWSGFGIRISVLNILSSYIFVIFYSVFWNMEMKADRPSSLLLSIISLIYFIPLSTWCGFGLGSTSLLIGGLFYWTLLSVLQIWIPVIYIKRNKKKGSLQRLYYILLILISGVTIYMSVKYTNFRILLSIGEKIYDVRAEASNYNIPTILSYFRSFSTILIPIFVIMSVRLKKYVWVIWGAFLILLNYSFDGAKTTLFMGIILIIGTFFWRTQMKYLILPGGIFIGILAILERVILDSHYVISYFFRRVCMVPAQLSDQYFRFFQNNPRDIFRSTLMGKVGFDSPYNLSLSFVIGNNYTNQIVSDNNGMLADAWAHVGPIGLVVMPIILIVCFRLFDMASRNIEAKYMIGLCIYYAVIFANGSWSTILLSHGFLVMCLMLWMFSGGTETETGKEAT